MSLAYHDHKKKESQDHGIKKEKRKKKKSQDHITKKDTREKGSYVHKDTTRELITLGIFSF